ncbi:MAG: non-ribosomal peptide synthetase [Dermatophilaceae bacterium]
MSLTEDLVALPARLPWVEALTRFGGRVALHTPDGPVTYAELRERVESRARDLAGPRRLAQVVGGTTADTGTVVALLAAQAAGHVVLLTPAGDAAAEVRRAYDPDVVLDADGVDLRRTESQHDLHPDLALLLSTSGSTGSPKLVKLSTDNLAANARQITEALGIRPDDCAALTLPLTYCYGLSVLTTHLSVGASVLLTGASVVDPCFWSAAEAAGVTTIPGVPHTFELLERSGFAERDLPARLRVLTQAGGRMAPERVRGFAELGRRRGFDLVAMYGQSEATARMATLPADLALTHPDTVGRAVPGGEIAIEDGEVVFRGPNVMLGYAREPADLALGRSVAELRTGDLGELTDEGLLRITGRKARFVKVLGHRLDLDALERRLADETPGARVAGRDGLIGVTVPGPVAAPVLESVGRAVVRRCRVPRDAVRVVAVDEPLVLANGKPDYAAVLALVDGTAVRGSVVPGDSSAVDAVSAVYADVLAVEVAPDATFVGLGGDSLSYVEASVRLEELLGRLPEGWHLMSVTDLADLTDRGSGVDPAAWGEGSATSTSLRVHRWLRWPTIETSIWLRAVAIVLIVGTHAGVVTLQGTANALLVIAGYQLARFQLSGADPRQRSRRIVGAVGRIAAPTLAVIVVMHLLLDRYEPRNLVLLNWVFGEAALGPPWRFWFIEALVVALLVVAALTRSRLLSRLDRRAPFLWPLVLASTAYWLFTANWPGLPVPRMHGSALVVLHLVLLGWALERARSLPPRLVASAAAVWMIGEFSGNPKRDGLTLAVVLVLLWVPRSRVPAVVVPALKVLAAASLYIYVIHWQALELLWEWPLLAFAGSLALGVVFWWLWTGPLTRQWAAIAPRLRAAAPGAARLRARLP